MNSSVSVPFSSILPDKTEIDQSKLDIADRTRVSLFSWNGQFSPLFIEALLDRYAFEDDVVYDPFSGSGTVLVESARKHLECYGVELNPSAYYMSKFAEIANLNVEQRNEIVKQIEGFLSDLAISNNSEVGLIDYYKNLPEGVLKNTLALLVILCDAYHNELNMETIGKQWSKIKNELINLPYSPNPIVSILGDTRNTSLRDESVSLIVTSPPYINVFNYHQNYRKSVEMLGYDVLLTARREFGSNRKNRGNRFLTVIQYTIDMALAFKECIRVSKTNARLIFVVGRESNVLSTKFSNSNILYRIGVEIFKLGFILKQERCFKNRFGQLIYEDIIHFSKNRLLNISNAEVVSRARLIALDVMNDALGYVDETHKELLQEAIAKINTVEPSEGIQYD